MHFTSYNINFDISSIIIFATVIFSYLQKKHVNNSQHKLFIYLFIASLITPFADILACTLIENQAPYLPTVLVNTFYYLSKQGTTFFYLLYVISQLEMKKHMSFIKEICICLPCGIVGVLVLLNPVTGWIFTYDEFIYHSRPLRYLTYASNIFYYYWSVLFAYKNKKWLAPSFPRLVLIISIYCTAVELIQLIWPGLLIHSLGISMTLLILVLNIDRYGMSVDSVTGMAKKEHLEKTCDVFFYNDHPFKSILIKMSDYELLTLNYGSENVSLMQIEMDKFLLSFVEAGKAFQTSSDTYVLILPNRVSADMVIEKIYEGLKRPWIINNLEMVSDFYITSVCCPQQIGNIISYTAMIQYFEKLQRPHTGIFASSEMRFADKVKEQQINKAIEDGLNNHNFSICYQPICTAKDRKFISAEALVRLTDPFMGSIPPAEFIPISEQNGTILDIGYFVIDSVCSFIEQHDMEKMGLKYIELNLSTIQCLQHNFIDVIEEITARHNVKPEYLCFEITETASNGAPSVFAENLKRLNERGYMLALDDFGTGYGNLQRMVTSDFHLIKFDREMTQRLSGEMQLKKVYKKLASMINGMGSKIVSEGIETQQQYEFARDAGSTYIQGYYFSKPLTEADFCDFILNVQELPEVQ